MRPKAAATPTANTPVPKPAAMVGARARDVVVEGAVVAAAPAPVEVGASVEDAEEEEDETPAGL